MSYVFLLYTFFLKEAWGDVSSHSIQVTTGYQGSKGKYSVRTQMAIIKFGKG